VHRRFEFSTAASVRCLNRHIGGCLLIQSHRNRRTDKRAGADRWHRAVLGGLQTGAHADLRIEERNTAWGKLRACLDHPQTVVRVGAWLGDRLDPELVEHLADLPPGFSWQRARWAAAITADPGRRPAKEGALGGGSAARRWGPIRPAKQN
jgi:hypothetical protein